MKKITLKVEKVGGQYLITSPEVPGLFVAHPRLSAARAAVRPTLLMLEQMAARRDGRKAMNNLRRA